ncbi:MAG: hypothetical protein ABSE48_17140 [Verrucomicrobiota bacterium]
MKKNNRNRVSVSLRRCQTAILTLAGALLITNAAPAQTTNAFDQASDPAYAGDGPPDGLAPGGQNGGFGFDAWTFSVQNTGGAFIQTSGPSGDSFDLWNTSGNSTTVAVRPFGTALVPGQSFSVQIQLNSLDSSSQTNTLALQDANGNTLFSYYHTGFEANANNGEYTDASTSNGSAVGFQYNYQNFSTFTFSLNSPTTYTFTDNTFGASFSGVITGSIAQVAFIRGNGNPPGNGQDIQFDELLITSSGQVAPPGFSQVTPIAGSFSVPITNDISAEIVPGGVALNTGSVSLAIDGTNVTPNTTTGVGGVLNVSYQPPVPLSAGTVHAVELAVEDANNNSYTNSWSFTTGFSSLPAVLPGPMVVSNNESGLLIFSAAGDGWLGTNYGPNSIRTVYARFSMAFNNLNGETGSGGGYGGLHFFDGTTPHLIVGNNWPSLNWSFDTSEGLEDDLTPFTPIVFNEWHTMVERIDYSPGGNATVDIWLDPDFTQTEANQPNAPYTLSMDDTFDNILLRTGNGTTSATFSNIVIAATSADAGFVPPTVPQFLGFVPGQNASTTPTNTPISVEVLFGSYGISTNDVTLTLDGNPVTPEFVVGTNSITVNYQSTTPFDADSSHTVMLSVTDSNGAPYSTSWAFTVDPYPSLPITVPGPIDVFSGQDDILFTSQNEWLGNNYGPNSTNTLYTRFSMTFFDLNGETGGGGGFGGLEFYLGATEQFLVGNNWLSTNWSVSVETESTADIPPVTPIVLGSYHTMVIKSVYSPVTNAAVKVWLDPDFTKTEGNQPNPPLALSITNTFDNIHLRCGNGTAHAQFTNIVLAATAPGVGFPTASPPAVLSIQTISGNAQLSWTSVGTLQVAPAATGPWTDSANQANPQILSTTNSAQFFRLQQ